MNVIKRNGDIQPVSFDKVQLRIRHLSNDLDVNETIVSQKICSRIFNNVKTSQLDELGAEMCATMITIHPDYGILAARLILSNHQKNTSSSFSNTIELLYNNTDIHGHHSPLISDKVYHLIQKNKETLDNAIVYSRDYHIDYFGFKTLEKSYSMDQ